MYVKPQSSPILITVYVSGVISIKVNIYSAGRHFWCLVSLTGMYVGSILFTATIRVAKCKGASGLFDSSSYVIVRTAVVEQKETEI